MCLALNKQLKSHGVSTLSRWNQIILALVSQLLHHLLHQKKNQFIVESS